MARPRRQPSTHLSKSRIMSGLQCEKRLWLEVHRPELKPTLTPDQERVFALGNEVGEEARNRFPGGRLVKAPFYDLPGSVRETAALVAQHDVLHIYEAAFEADGTHVKVDVLSRTEDSKWRLIEVKSTSTVKDQHVTDAAIQWHVVEGAGVAVSSCNLMHLNRDCRYPDLSDLFTVADISQAASVVRTQVPALIARMHDVVTAGAEPSVHIGTKCTKPYECPFKERCWQHVPVRSVFTIPRLSSEIRDSLASRNLLRLEAVPPDDLNPAQTAYVQMSIADEPVIDIPAIRTALATFEFPLYFLDFETCADAIPRLDGLGPWKGYPFQYSLHVMEHAPQGPERAQLVHREYLHEDLSDPRLPLAEALCRDVGETGTLIAYNASFEQKVIEGLAKIAPNMSDRLRALIPRFFDLLVIFRRHYAHPGFLGSNSIKNVLPVLVPELTYDGMAVSNGEAAQAVWASLVSQGASSFKSGGDIGSDAQATFGFEREATLANLREYCRLDTLAMVRIFEVLREM